jgi:G:T-mismatch repair DNA endonuclease (very short patch repair protein)
MKNLCKCGCGISLRKDNKTGYQKGHKPCPVCGTLVKGSGIECCSKSCSAKLHWQRNPEMKESRVWNDNRYATREKNRDRWINNLSKACKGRTPWNKDTKGLQVAWNKNLPAEAQPMFGKKKPKQWIKKYKQTNLERYGVENPGVLAKSSSRSKQEKRLENILIGYYPNKIVGRYKPDYLNEKTKHIIEIYGDYWHCNPKNFDPNFYHSRLKRTAKEKWEEDLKRKQVLESMGYQVTVVWESDLDEFIKTLTHENTAQ